MQAFRRALDVGANAIETDCHVTRDGHVVLAHDASGVRMAGVTRAIADATLDEVRAWDMGKRFVDRDGRRFAGEGFRMPMLEEALVELRGVPLNVDVKSRAADAAARVVAIVRRANATETTLLTSFDARVVRRVRALGYEGPTGLARSEVLALLCAPTRALRVLRLRGNAAQLPHRLGPVDLGRRAIIDKCHALGLDVHYWTVNDPERARSLYAMGADGVMTDDPRALAGAYSDRHPPSSHRAARRCTLLIE